jgi:hypothetical protein
MARKKNWKRVQSCSFIPRFASEDESSREESILRLKGRARYNANRGLSELGESNWNRGLTREQLAAVYAHRRQVKLKTERLQMIKELAEW